MVYTYNTGMEVITMPWKEAHVLDERLEFICMCLKGDYSMAELCREFGISRPTGYKFAERYEQEGPQGLHDLSRAPHSHPNAIPKEIEDMILGAKAAHPTWGPRKLLPWLQRKIPGIHWPVNSTTGEILKRHGLTCSRRCRRKATPSSTLTLPDGPNAVWCADLKGWFRTRDGRRCDPLTIMDAHSRYLLRCQVLAKTDTATVMPIFTAAFREFGLPAVIRTDNGSPFSSVGLGGLSHMSLWFLKLGITPERIRPGCPYENGSHERMHRTLKNDICRDPAANLRAQQRDFDGYLPEYNEERPHEALGYQTPAEFYVPSLRRYPLRVPEFTYPEEFTVRSVHKNGCIRWGGHEIFISEVFSGEWVGFLHVTDRHWKVYIGPLAVGVLDESTKRLLPEKSAKQFLQLKG